MNEYVAGSTSIVDLIFLQDSTKTDGSGKTGLVFNTAGLTCYYKRSNGTASVAITLVTITTLGTFVSGGFKEIDATNQSGAYEFHPPNAAFASGAKEVTFFFQGATGLAARPIKYRILAVDPDTAGANGIYPSDAKAINGVSTSTLTTINAILGFANAAGAANGPIINGANTGPLSISGGVTFSNSGGDAFVCSASGGNGNGINASGNGTGDGLVATGGATGRGLYTLGGATSGEGLRAEAQAGTSNGIRAIGFGAGLGISVTGGATGAGMSLVGGATSGNALNISTTNGHGIDFSGVAGISKHGLKITGGSSGVSDGINVAAGSGGSAIRAASITGTLDTVTTATNLTNAPTNGDFTGAMKTSLNAATPASVVGSVGSVVSGVTLAASQHVIVDSGTVTTVTNQLTAAQIATGVWQDTTAGDFTVAGSIGRSLFTSGNVPGAAGGLFIAGSNAATTVNFTGNLSGSVGSVAAAITLPGIPNGWITAAGIFAAALNGKGDWLLSSSYLAPDNSDIVAALNDLVVLLARTDPTSALAAIKAVTDGVATMLTPSGLNKTYTVDALKNSPAGGGGGSIKQITDAQITINDTPG